ncbi:MAG TPA: hypothetical protein VEW04_02685 [Allosphingosinicella sp.]|nr:hypothetical protein [Allosphingosinicella sp.]
MAAEVVIAGALELPDDAGTLWLRDYSKVESSETNLGLMDASGMKKWDAAEVQTLDKWVAVRFDDGRILANSFGGFLCELSLEDGSILSTTFVK